VWKIAAHSPTTLAHLIRLGNTVLSKTQLNPKLRETAVLCVSEILGCDYERAAHIVMGKAAGMTDEQISSIKKWQQSGIYSKTEQSVLRFTDEFIRNGKPSQSTFADLEKHMSHRELMELTVTIGFYELLAKLLLTFEVDMEDSTLTPLQIAGKLKD
jgi:AhpD family alkylhydroperoxidase